MAKVKVVLNRGAIRDQLLKGAETERVIQEYGNRAYAALEGINGYEMELRFYPERIGIALFADDYPAISDNFSNNTLLKAVKNLKAVKKE